MSTLKELMGDKTRGDGRKFAKANWDTDRWFEPIFYYEKVRCWIGLNTDGWLNEISDAINDWNEWTPPKQTKKVKLYRPIRKIEETYYAIESWMTDKPWFLSQYNDIVGWQEMEVEVEE